MNTPIEYPLNVLYRIDSIDYKIKYLNDYNLSKDVKLEVNENQQIISKDISYFIYIQNKNAGRINVIFYSTDDGSLIKKYKFVSYDGFFKLLEELNSCNYIFIKNVRREMYYLREHYPIYYNKLNDIKIYCLDTYLKYQLCLPLYVQGKASKRFRIPNIDEYLEKRQMKPFSPQKSEFSRMRQFISIIVVNLINVVRDFHNINRGEKIHRGHLIEFINYMLINGFEKTHIVLISSSKKRLEKPDAIDCLSLEQYFKYITNYKRDYQVLILDGIPDTFKNIPHVYFLT